MAFDGTNMWAANTYDNNVETFSLSGTPLYTYAAGLNTIAIAFDGTNMWVSDRGGTVTELSATGATLGTFTVGSYAAGIAFDGMHMWVTNSGDNTVTEL
jgi:DNA-binding beta-propeller fold protein YncE